MHFNYIRYLDYHTKNTRNIDDITVRISQHGSAFTSVTNLMYLSTMLSLCRTIEKKTDLGQMLFLQTEERGDWRDKGVICFPHFTSYFLKGYDNGRILVDFVVIGIDETGKPINSNESTMICPNSQYLLL